jgi:PTS system ascorbate-specific IIA component
MVGVLLITHGGTGTALLAAASHVLGAAQVNARAIAVAPGDDTAAVLERARRDLAAVDDGGGVIVFTDIYGATPSNVGARLLQSGHVEGVAGVSLPMLVRALAYRALPLQQVLDRALEAGTRGQINIKEDSCHAAAGGS